MKRIMALALPLLVLAGVMVTIAWLEARRGPDWKIELNQHLARSGLPGETLKIRAVVEASQPWNFRATMGQPVRNAWTWEVDELPYPPTAMRCVLLERGSKSASGVAGAPKRQVLYVGYHTDTLWRAGWLVHEGPQAPFAPELAAELAAIGCDF